jgi:hypothetical protein
MATIIRGAFGGVCAIVVGLAACVGDEPGNSDTHDAAPGVDHSPTHDAGPDLSDDAPMDMSVEGATDAELDNASDSVWGEDSSDAKGPFDVSTERSSEGGEKEGGGDEIDGAAETGADAAPNIGWVKLCIPGSWPTARESFALTFDSMRNKVFMFGGAPLSTGNGAPPPLQETWEWDASSGLWTNLAGCQLPPAHWPASKLASATYDASSGKIFMFDGATDRQWSWDPRVNDWIDRTPSVLPADWPNVKLGMTRTTRLLAYDTDRQKVVLSGGEDAPANLEVWDWDESNGFVKRVPSPLPDVWPLQRTLHGMAYDEQRKTMFFFGGIGSSVDWLWDTWEWNGTSGSWTDRTPYPHQSGWPLGTAPGSMTYDKQQQRAYVFGGNQAPPRDQLWEWNGSGGTWSDLTPSPRPVNWPQESYPFNTGNGVHLLHTAFDSTRALTVGFDGSHLWELDGRSKSWTDRTPCRGGASSPLAVNGPMMAFDSLRKQVVLLRPGSVSSTGEPVEVWQWNAANGVWVNRTPCTLPTPWPANPKQNSTINGFVYDKGRDRFVLIPSCIACQFLETWELDPVSLTWVNWTPTAPNPPPWPAGRWSFSTTYDEARGVVVLFGGANQNPPFFAFNETWEWNGTQHGWANRTPATSPHERFFSSLIYDPVRSVALLFGGGYDTQASGRRDLNDLWQWDGSTGAWTDRTPAMLPVDWPSPRLLHQMTFDVRRSRTLLFGGWHVSASGSTFLSDTWEWDGGQSTWSRRTSAASPDMEQMPTMVYDAGRDRVLFFGSSGATWQWWGGP